MSARKRVFVLGTQLNEIATAYCAADSDYRSGEVHGR